MEKTTLFHRSGSSAERRQFRKKEMLGFLSKAATAAFRFYLKMIFAALPLALGGNWAAEAQDNPSPSAATAVARPESGGITDAEIRDVVARVAKHQMHPLADGAYLAVTNLDAARAAKSPEGIEWDYPWGVALCGMLRSTDVTGDPAVSQFVVQHNQICARYFGWLAGLEKLFGKTSEVTALERRSKVSQLMSLGSLDSCGAMGNQLIESMIRYPDQVTPEEKMVLARIADWIVSQQDRLPDGTLWRSKNMGGTVWPDDLYMGGVFLVRYGIYTGDRKYIDDAASNIVHQAALEQDADGLWFHGYFEGSRTNAPFKWGRGNGWAMVALVEILSAMPENDPLRLPLLDILRKQITGLKKVQVSDGRWRQVLDKPELWEETSCTAMFAYGIARAVNRGWIDPSNMAVARKAFAGISKQVTPDGAVNGTCEGTGIGRNLEFYITRKQPVDDMHGRGPVMLAGTEILLGSKE
jgi:unsaturated rhamnogalacturonyl hydrolase